MGRSSISIVCAASNRLLRKAASGLLHDKAPVSMRKWKFIVPKSIAKNSILRLFSQWQSVVSRRHLVSPSRVNRSCGEVWSPVTVVCFW